MKSERKPSFFVTSKILRLIVTVGVICGIFFGLILPAVPQAHAFTNGIFNQFDAMVCASSASCTAASIVTQVGDLLVFSIACQTSVVAMTSLTDGSADVFTRATTAIQSASGFATLQESTWYASSAAAGTSGTFTITLSSTATNCHYYVADVNVAGTLLFDSSSAVGQIPGAGTTNLNSKIYNAPAGTYFMNIVFGTAATSTPDNIVAVSPLVSEKATIPTSGYQLKVADTYQSAAFFGTLTDSVTSTQGSNLVLNSVAFATTGSPSTCSNSTFAAIGGPHKDGALANHALASNITYAFFGQAGAGGATITSLSLGVKAIALTNGQTSAKLTIAVYTGTTFTPTTTNPMTRTPASTFTFTIVNNASPQNITISNLLIPVGPSLVYDVAVGISHDGVTAYNADHGPAAIFIDNSDPFTSQIPPLQQTSFGVGPNPSLNLYGTALGPCVITGTSVTTTVTVTNGGGSAGGGFFSGASGSQWPIVFLLLLLPTALFMAVTKSLVGSIIGLMIGAIIAVMANVIPNYIFLGLVIACVSVAFVARKGDIR